MMKKRLEEKQYFNAAIRAGLKDRLNSIQTRQNRINEERFDYMKQVSKDMGKDMIIETQHTVNKLQNIVDDLTKLITEEDKDVPDANYFKFKD